MLSITMGRRSATSLLPCILLAFVLFSAIIVHPLFGQQREKIVSIGVGAEVNNNSGSGIGLGASASIGFNFANNWALGVAAKGSHDLSSAWVLEGMALLRCYFPGEDPWQGEFHSGFYAQAEGGIHWILEDNVFMYEGEDLLRPLGGLRLGYRFLLGSVIYLEPYARGGYPFFWGAGLMAGVRF